MPSAMQGAIRLGRLAGVTLYLHWSWFLVAGYEIQSRRGTYSSVAWNVAEYVALFAIVLTHEFGHAMACRSVGGQADTILLWPFGGVAYVAPPQRAGAQLWSIAAGPLVNVALAPVFYIAWMIARSQGWRATNPDVYHFLFYLLWIDVGLLVFNILPVYPLDGGQILRSLLWYPLGRGRSLLVATVVGFVGIAGLLALAVYDESLWTGAISVYLGMNCWSGFQRARAMLTVERLPRRPGFACPSCGMAPPLGPYWKCGQCGQVYDTFATGSACPQCSARGAATMCVDCRQSAPMEAWAGGVPADAALVSSSFEMK